LLLAVGVGGIDELSSVVKIITKNLLSVLAWVPQKQPFRQRDNGLGALLLRRWAQDFGVSLS
jgi:hypothetical protein